jgi:hypothetical protein
VIDKESIYLKTKGGWFLFGIKEGTNHSTSGFGPKGNKECEYLTLFKGLEENNL